MRSTVLLMVVAALAVEILGAPQAPGTSSKDAYIVEQENDFNGIDPWKWSYLTSDGQSREENGQLTADGESVAVRGSYTWTDPGGVSYSVSYTADDDNGFVAKVTRLDGGAAVRPAAAVTTGRPLGVAAGLPQGTRGVFPGARPTTRPVVGLQQRPGFPRNPFSG